MRPVFPILFLDRPCISMMHNHKEDIMGSIIYRIRRCVLGFTGPGSSKSPGSPKSRSGWGNSYNDVYILRLRLKSGGMRRYFNTSGYGARSHIPGALS